MFPLDPIWPFYMEKIAQKRAEKGSPSLIHNKKQCPDARSDLDQLQTYLDLGGGAKPSPMAPGNFRSVHWFIGFFGIFRDLYILIRHGEGAPPGTFFFIHPTPHNPSETWWNYPILGEKCQNWPKSRLSRQRTRYRGIRIKSATRGVQGNQNTSLIRY